MCEAGNFQRTSCEGCSDDTYFLSLKALWARAGRVDGSKNEDVSVPGL